MSEKSKNPSTLATHVGEEDDHHGSVAPSIVMSTTYRTRPGEAAFSAHEYDPDRAFLYSRWGHPNARMLERKIAALEGVEDALATASGMAAMTAIFLGLLRQGDHAVVSNVSYAGVGEISHEVLPDLGIDVTHVDTSDPANIEAALRDNTKLVHIETPANPILRITDIKAAAKLAHGAGAKLSVDSTFATPIATRPADFGADFIMHSMTKYIGGHGDVLGGVVAGSKADISKLRARAGVYFGATLAPQAAWLAARSLHTLPLRMGAHEASARALAEFLAGHAKVERVIYPGLASHPQHAVAKKQMRNFGGMLAVTLKGGEPAIARVLDSIEVITHAISLGKTKSLAFFVSTDELQQHAFQMPGQQLADYRAIAGDGVLRISAGIEDPGDLVADMEQALDKV